MTDPSADNTTYFTEDGSGSAGEPGNVEAGEHFSARVRAQRRFTLARSAISDAGVRARRSATLPTRQRTITAGDNEASPLSTALERVSAYRTYIFAAVDAVLAVIAVARRRHADTPQTEDRIDLGTWDLRADPPTDDQE